MEYKLIRSKRRTLGVQVNENGITVRAPLKIKKSEIDDFVLQHKEWIEKSLAKVREQKKQSMKLLPITVDDVKSLAEKAKRTIPERVRHYAPIIGVNYGRITIRNQRSRWGSCSGKGNLNFNCLLMLTPPEVLDSVVVHELCHRKEMNHSKKFYAEVLRVFPDYWKWNNWLKEHGDMLIKRMKLGERNSEGETRLV